MNIAVDYRPGGLAIVNLVGRLEMESATELRKRLIELVAAGQHRLVIRLAEVTFVDSMGVGALIAGLKAARLEGGDLHLISPPEQARAILRVTMLDQVLRLYPTEAAALAGL